MTGQSAGFQGETDACSGQNGIDQEGRAVFRRAGSHVIEEMVLVEAGPERELVQQVCLDKAGEENIIGAD
mgnify:CR=1 FL=1